MTGNYSNRTGNSRTENSGRSSFPSGAEKSSDCGDRRNVHGRYVGASRRILDLRIGSVCEFGRYVTLNSGLNIVGKEDSLLPPFSAPEQIHYDLSHPLRLTGTESGVSGSMDENGVGSDSSSGGFSSDSMLEYFARLWHRSPDTVPGPDRSDHRRDDILATGSLDANLYGLCNARDYLKGRMLVEDPINGDRSSGGDSEEAVGREQLVYANPLPALDNPNAYRPIVFYSQDAHYSVVQAVRLLELTTFYQEGRTKYPGQCPITRNGEWPEEVPSHDYDKNDPLSGTIRIDDLTTLVRFFAGRGYPVIIVLNLGTTWKGAYDDVPAVDKMLQGLEEEFPWLWNRNVEYGTMKTESADTRRGFWVHVDGTPGALFLPFIEMAWQNGLIDRTGPIFDFRNESVMSIGCSMHRWMDSAWPSGIYMTRKPCRLLPPEIAGYTDTDLVSTTCRNFSQHVYEKYFEQAHHENNVRKALERERLAAYLEMQLRVFEDECRQRSDADINLWIARSRLSLEVRFRLANPEIRAKWNLGTERLRVTVGPNLQQIRSYSHLSVIGLESFAQVDAFIEDLRSAASEDIHNAFPLLDGRVPNPGPQMPSATPGRFRSGHRTVMSYQGKASGTE